MMKFYFSLAYIFFLFFMNATGTLGMLTHSLFISANWFLMSLAFIVEFIYDPVFDWDVFGS